MLSDIEIALAADIKPIETIANAIGLNPNEDTERYGRYKAKITAGCYDRLMKGKTDGKLILVTAINPTPAGEGKTTMTIGLGQALSSLGHKTVIALREPSMGPVFGMKGGAAGGGYSQVIPMDEINLHFTGDIHAITAANNLLCALIDNHIFQGNELNIAPDKVTFTRCMDMNDRSLREISLSPGGSLKGWQRVGSFKITAASEIMAIFCLAESMPDLKEKLGNIIIGYTDDDKPVYCRDLKAEGAMCTILKEALNPNLVQTIEGTPCVMHGGPFANIAHGCNSVKATKLAMKLGDYAVTEAGFGADLGAEKFFDIKCFKTGITPSAVVLTATIRALKYNGGVPKEALSAENVDCLRNGFVNLLAHYNNIKKFGYAAVVAINRFASDSSAEIAVLSELCAEHGIRYAMSEAYAHGGAGSIELAQLVIDVCEKKENSSVKYMYSATQPVKEKISALARGIYGASGVEYSKRALGDISRIEALGYGGLPVCVAKTQYSLSDNPALLGKPEGFKIKVKSVSLSAGAGFIVVLTGSIMTMPGLPKIPAAEAIDVDSAGNVVNLF